MAREAKVFATESNLSLLLRLQGIHSVSELARRCEMPESSINAAVNGKRERIFGSEPGTYRRPARRIAEILGVPPEVLFDEDPDADERRKCAETAFAQDTVRIPLSPEDEAIQSSLRRATTCVLASLTPREERVLRTRFGIGMKNPDDVLGEVGNEFSVTRERIREIEAKAHAKLKHPARSRTLRSLLDDGLPLK